jgi:hypothetical protein
MLQHAGKKNTRRSARSIDSADQRSQLGKKQGDSLVWNVLNQNIPRFGSSGRFDNSIHNVLQTVKIGSILSSSNTLPTFAGVYFTANAHISQFSSWAAVFDQYRIEEMEVWLEPDVTNLSTVTNLGLSKFYSIVDYDDANTPVQISDLMQYSNVIVSGATTGHYRKWRPHVAMAAFQSTFTGYANVASPWLDCASGDIQHYGIKVGMDALPSTLASVVVATVRIWVQFKNVR